MQTILQPPTPGTESSTAEWANYLAWAKLMSEEARHAETIRGTDAMVAAQVEANRLMSAANAAQSITVSDLVKVMELCLRVRDGG